MIWWMIDISNYWDRYFHIVSAERIKSILPEKSVENLKSSQINFKHTFEMRFAIKKHLERRGRKDNSY